MLLHETQGLSIETDSYQDPVEDLSLLTNILNMRQINFRSLLERIQFEDF